MDAERARRIARLKQRIEGTRRGELAEADAVLRDAETRAERLSVAREAAANALAQTGEVRAEELLHRAGLMALARRDAAQADLELSHRSDEREQKREHLAEAHRETRAVDALRRRMLAEARQVEQRHEQRELDEAASRKGGSR